MKKITSKSWLLIGILTVAVIIRFLGYASWSLTNDELSALLGYSYGSLNSNIQNYVMTDFHPAGVQVIIWFWCKIFGTSVVALRFPFVIMGIATVYLSYLTSRKWFNFYAATLVAATMAVSQFALLYSQIARPYSSGLFFVLLCLHGWNGFVFLEKNQRPKFKSLIYFIVGMLCSMYNHYFSFLMVAIIGLTGVFMVNHLNRKMYLLCGVSAVILFLPHLKITLHQFSAGGLGWLAPPDSDFFGTYIKYIFNQSKWYFIFIVCCALIAAIKIPFQLPQNRLKWIALLWFLIPLFTAYFYSIYISPVLQNSILLFSYPFMLFFIFSLTPNHQKLVYFIVPAILIAGTIQIYAVNKFNGSNEFARFKEIAENIDKADKKYGSKQITRAINITDSTYIAYYLRQLNNNNPFVFYHNSGREESGTLVKLVQKASTPYFMYAWTNSDCPPVINAIIQIHFPYLIERVHYFNCEFYLYSKKEEDKKNQILSIENEFTQHYDGNAVHFSAPAQPSNDTLTEASIIQCELMDEKVEYSSTFSIPLAKLTQNTSNILHASVLLKPISAGVNPSLVFSIDHGDKNYFWNSLELKTFLENGTNWTKCYYSIRLPMIEDKSDIVKVYILNNNKNRFLIDDFSVKVEQGNENLYGPRKDRNKLIQ